MARAPAQARALVSRASRIFLYFPPEIKKNTAGSQDYQGPGFDIQQLLTFHYFLFHLHKSMLKQFA